MRREGGGGDGGRGATCLLPWGSVRRGILSTPLLRHGPGYPPPARPVQTSLLPYPVVGASSHGLARGTVRTCMGGDEVCLVCLCQAGVTQLMFYPQNARQLSLTICTARNVCSYGGRGGGNRGVRMPRHTCPVVLAIRYHHAGCATLRQLAPKCASREQLEQLILE